MAEWNSPKKQKKNKTNKQGKIIYEFTGFHARTHLSAQKHSTTFVWKQANYNVLFDSKNSFSFVKILIIRIQSVKLNDNNLAFGVVLKCNNIIQSINECVTS